MRAAALALTAFVVLAAGPAARAQGDAGDEARVGDAGAASRAYDDLDAGAAFVDAGHAPAVAVDDPPIVRLEPDEDADVADLPAFAATYREQPSPLVFRLPVRGKDAPTRARQAGTALASALDNAPIPDAPLVEVKIDGDVADVRVQGRSVAFLSVDDARAAGAPALQPYAAELETRLYDFVRSQLTRSTLQTFALHLFLSVFIGVLVFLTLRALRGAFDRWEQSLEDRGGDLRPISVFKVPVLGGEALRGLLAFGLAVGRALAYATTILVGAAAILGQFDATRPFLGDVAQRVVDPLRDGVGEAVAAVPRLLLAVAIVVALRAGLKVVHILLDGVAGGRLTLKVLPPPRVPVARAVLTGAAMLVAVPLVVATVFGRFGTPLELLVLGFGVTVALAAAPVLASGIVGLHVAWKGVVRPGEWVDVDGAQGEVAGVSLTQIVLVPEDGGTMIVPMLLLAVKPVRRLHRLPTCDVDLRVARDAPAGTLIAAAKAAVVPIVPEVVIDVVDVAHAWLLLRARVPLGPVGRRDAVLRALLAAVDDGKLRLYDDRPAAAGPPT